MKCRRPLRKSAILLLMGCLSFGLRLEAMNAVERQVTRGPGGRILTNTGVWSPDGQWIVYDTRSGATGEVFDGTRIEAVHVSTGEIRRLYESRHGACCGVVTFHPRERRVVFIRGPEYPSPEWQYAHHHREGVWVDWDRAGVAANLDARDLTPPFTPGALRGGSHVHVWDAVGDWVSFTYNDAICESGVRDVAVSMPVREVKVDRDHSRNHDGHYFTVVVSRTTPTPSPGSNEILRACEEGWIGREGYVRADGTRQRRALAMQGHVLTAQGQTNVEVFVLDLPEDLLQAGEGPLAGTASHRPFPPRGVAQRRLTFTEARKHPGLQGPRHWLRTSPDGEHIAFLMKDDEGTVQLWTVSPRGGPPVQITRNRWPIASAITWSPDGRFIAHVMDRSVCVTELASGRTTRLTPEDGGNEAPRPEACVFSPDGRRIAFIRRKSGEGGVANQICVIEFTD